MIYIDNIFADEVMDSRGNPTVRATVSLSDGSSASAIVPSGASTGKSRRRESKHRKKSRGGAGVTKEATFLRACLVNGDFSGCLPGSR